MENEKVRLQKIIADSNISISRRKAEKLIQTGEVFVNGKRANLGDKADINKDEIIVQNKRIELQIEKYYIAIYKPRGIICTASDDRGRKCITELVTDIPERIYPVGRLDKDSEGLIFMTNDGKFANSVMHPRFKLGKTYRVTVAEKVDDEKLAILKSGMLIDNTKTIPAQVEIVSNEDGRCVMLITIYQGINRQIRKMCENVNLTVKRLKRVSIGSVKLKMLRPGEYRFLDRKEIKSLMRG